MGAGETSSLNNLASAPCYLPRKEPQGLYLLETFENSEGFNVGAPKKNNAEYAQYVVCLCILFVNHSFSSMHTDRVPLPRNLPVNRHSQMIQKTSTLLSNFLHNGEDPCLSGFQNENGLILLMAEILHHLGCMKPYK